MTVTLPDWLTAKLTPEPAAAQPIRPSGAGDGAALSEQAKDAAARKRALLRGMIVHRLMQSLPELPPAQQAEAARRHIARQETEFEEAEREEIVSRVLALLADPRFAALFAAGSRAEVSIVGRLGGRMVSGQVDRLLVAPEAVLIADYKTNRPAPRGLNQTRARHPGYVAQLALYRAVLMRLYPDRPVRAALLWTDTPELVEIPAAHLDSACRQVLTAA
jgi:ATP-dependent helicase/nuclease subunit A